LRFSRKNSSKKRRISIFILSPVVFFRMIIAAEVRDAKPAF